MLSPRELAEAKVLFERVQRGSVTREDWSNLAALTLLASGDEVIGAIAAQSFDQFLAISQPIYDGHAFRPEDYRRIYDRICAASGAYGSVH